MNTRIANGLPMKTTEAVAADVISKIAGVPLATTVKVMTALNLLSKATEIDMDALTKYEALPTAPADDDRYQRTEDFVEQLIHRVQKKDLRHMANDLKVHKRFRQAA